MSDNLEWADHVGKGAAKASRQIARLTKERDELREALDALMAAVFIFQLPEARDPGYGGNPYRCPSPLEGSVLLKAWNAANITRANLNKTDGEPNDR